MHKTLASVYYDGRLAGQLSRISGSPEVAFTYDKQYLKYGLPIAYLLPLQEEPFICKGLHPYFDSMVSEGWLKRQQSQTQKIDPENRLELLINNAYDLPGMVTISKVVDENEM